MDFLFLDSLVEVVEYQMEEEEEEEIKPTIENMFINFVENKDILLIDVGIDLILTFKQIPIQIMFSHMDTSLIHNNSLNQSLILLFQISQTRHQLNHLFITIFNLL